MVEEVEMETPIDRFKRIREVMTDREPFLSSLVYKLDLKESSETSTLCTDGKTILFNHKFTDTLSDEELCGVFFHEVLHCAMNHLWRIGKRDFSKWNIATDYAINTTVVETFPLPKGSLLNKKYKGMSAEQIYDRLPKNSGKEKGGKGKDEKSDEKGDGEQSWCEKDPWEGQSKKETNILKKIFGKKKQMSPKEKSNVEESWERAFEEVISKHYGNLPSNLQRIIRDSHYIPSLDWNSIISSILSEDVNDYSFYQPDRRFLDGDFLFPGTYSVDNLKDVVFAYDTSGSIQDEYLKSFYQETLNLLNGFPNLRGWSVVCDSQIHEFQEIDSTMSFEDMKFNGGGGTAFEPVFDEIESRRVHPRALFYFTDTDGSFPDEAPSYPVFWLVHSGITTQKPEYSVPFGEVIPFMNKS